MRDASRYRPETYVRNVLETIDCDGFKSDLLGVNYLLHCLPGDMAMKARAFDFLSPLMSEGACRSRLDAAAGRRRAQLRGAAIDGVLQFQGHILEYADDLGALTRELENRFDAVNVETVGCAALFSARVANSGA
ncbi:MAG: hypothetical protein U1E25_16535 [Methylocystis sp.]